MYLKEIQKNKLRLYRSFLICWRSYILRGIHKFSVVFDDFHKFVPRNKVSNSAGPSGISPKLLSLIWPSFKIKLNNLVSEVGLKYPKLDAGYFQRMIPKISGEITELKQLRPLGVLNPLEKYFFNKAVFLAIRDHLSDLLKSRNNFFL